MRRCGTARGGARRGARGTAGRGRVGFQSAGDSGRGPDPARRCRCRCPCPAPPLFPAGKASGPRAEPVAVRGARRPAELRDGTKVGLAAPRPGSPRLLPAASPSLPPPLLAGGTRSVGACCGCFPSPRFSPLSPGPAPRQVSGPARGWHRLPPHPGEVGFGCGRGCGARLIPGHKRESSPLGAHWGFCHGFPGRCRRFEGRMGVSGPPERVECCPGTRGV